VYNKGGFTKQIFYFALQKLQIKFRKNDCNLMTKEIICTYMELKTDSLKKTKF
jgi:hypothetical protein